MANSKEEPRLEDMKILDKLNKRLDIIENNNAKLRKTQEEQTRKVENQRKIQKEEVMEFQKQCQEIEEHFKELKKIVFTIGHKLKDKVTKDEMEAMKKRIESWPLEEYINRNELEKTYNNHKYNEVGDKKIISQHQ